MSSTRKILIDARVLLFVLGIPMTIYGIVVISFALAGNSVLMATLSIGVMGFILLAAGITSILVARFNRAKVLGALRTYTRISLDQLSSELNMSKKRTRKAILYLRAANKLKASFDGKTGDILVYEVENEQPVSFKSDPLSELEGESIDFAEKQKTININYCSYCGSILKEDNRFCNNCGIFLQND